MGDGFQRLFMMAEPEILPLNAQAALGPVRLPERSQFAHLYRHFLERFFNHETASPDGDAKTRMVQVAFAAGLPGFMVALYLYPVYHPFIAWPPGHALKVTTPPYWVQVNHHFFFVLYAFVSMGIATVFEWDMFFPDLLDVFVLTTLPIRSSRLLLARVAAIAIFIVAFLFDANILAVFILPAVFDPPNLPRLLAGHLAAVALSGLFAAVFVLAAQGLLLSVLGERLFRRFSLALQGLAIALLLVFLLLFPVFSAVIPVVLRSGGLSALCFPPFWFLGIYQRLLEGHSALPIYGRLAEIGCSATLIAAFTTVLTYPIAYLRKVRHLVVGPGARSTHSQWSAPLDQLLHATVLRPPVRRAVFHFIGQTILRVPRYRIYLVLYGGAGLSVVVASVLRFNVAHNQVQFAISADGVRAATGIVAFWIIAGLRMAFVSPGNQRGNWIFRIVNGRPAHFHAAIEQLLAAKVWVLLAAGALTLGVLDAFHAIAPPELLTRPAIAAQMLVAGGMCLLLTDIFFLNVNVIAFTGDPVRGHSNMALNVLKYYTVFPLVAWFPVASEPWIETSAWHFGLAGGAIAAAHLLLRASHRRKVRDHSELPGLEEDEDEFPMKLGLRY
jgi:hypothetical protein